MEPRTRREIERQVDTEGLRIVSMTDAGTSHIKVMVQAPDGRTALLMFAATASDWRAGANNRGRLRRFARGLSLNHERPQHA